MKRIILVRHAKAAGHGRCDDIDRTLRKRGRRAARAVAGWCAEYLDPPDRLVTSPAARASETAAIFAKALGHRRKVAVDRRLYDAAGPEDILAVLNGLGEAEETVMLFGHNPTFEEFANAIAPAFNQALPTCAVVVIDTRRRRWATLAFGDGTVYAFQHPRALDAAHTRMEE